MSEIFDFSKSNNQAENKERGPRKRILFAEDDEGLRHALVEYVLAPEGYEVTAVKDGSSLLAQLDFVARAQDEKVGYDLIVTDNNMPPGISGVEALEKIRKDSQYAFLKDIPVIVHSGEDVEEAVRKLGGTYLAKGNPKNLLKTVESKLS